MTGERISMTDIFVVFGVLMMAVAAYQLGGIWALVGLVGLFVVVVSMAITWASGAG